MKILLVLTQVKIHDEREGFPVTSVREIKLLSELQDHPNIVRFKEVVVG
jgi:serine/threonine protein kinase